MLKINELSTGFLDIEFENPAGELEVPTSARYRIDCLTTGNQVVTWTAITGLAASMTLTIANTLNAMQDGANNSIELKRVTVEATYDVDDVIYEKYDYQLRNLNQVPAV